MMPRFIRMQRAARARWRAVGCWLLIALLAVSVAGASDTTLAVLSAADLAKVISFGPWPAPAAATADSSNRVSGNPDAIDLGRRLFFDPRMSPIGYVACVSCHQPDRAWSDGKPRAHGVADLMRNTISLANLRLQRWYGWGGTGDSLWQQSIRPILDPREVDSNLGQVRRLFVRDPELACAYRKVFGSGATAARSEDETVLVNVAKALAAFIETLNTARTPFDDFRDALARNDFTAAARYPVAAARGLRVFVNAGHCADCHDGANFSDGDFHAVAPPRRDVSLAPDAGQLEGIESLRASRFNLLGRYNDGDAAVNASATRQLRLDDRARARIRTPSLRNVAVTAPYLHDGRAATLREAIQHGIDSPGGAEHDGKQRRTLSARETDDLLAFLATLTDHDGALRPHSTAPDSPLWRQCAMAPASLVLSDEHDRSHQIKLEADQGLSRSLHRPVGIESGSSTIDHP